MPGQTVHMARFAQVLAQKVTLSVGLSAAAFAGAAHAQTTKDMSDMTQIHVIIGDEVLSATLDDTAPGRDFAAMLPLELTLSDYHSTEKIADLPRKLDITGAPSSYTPDTGDITLYAPWGNLAIFYKPFRNSQGLVRLGEFDGAIDALKRNGDFTVRIETAE